MREAVTLAPNSALMHLWLAHAEGMRGNTAEGSVSSSSPSGCRDVYAASITIANLAYAYGQNGRPDDAARLRDKLAERAPDRRLDAGNWALAHLGAGDENAAQASLETIVDKIDREEPDAGYLTLALIRANMYSYPALDQPVFQRLHSQVQGR